MVDLEDPAFKQCLSLLESGSDEERFVGILLVKSIVQPTDYRALSRVYQSLGLEFLYRLLKSKDTQGEESISYINLSITLLSTFTALEYPESERREDRVVEKIIGDPLMDDLVVLLLQRCIDQSENHSFIKEALQFMVTVSSGDSIEPIRVQLQNIQLLSDLLLKLHRQATATAAKETLDSLSMAIDHIYLVAWKTSRYLVNLNSSGGGDSQASTPPLSTKSSASASASASTTSPSSVQLLNSTNRLINPLFQLLEALSIVFRERVDEIKFALLPTLVIILQIHSSNEGIVIHKTAEINSTVWRSNLKYAVYSILSSRKLKDEFRDRTVLLLSVLLDFAGSEFFALARDTVPTDTFLLLALQWARTEVHLILLSVERETVLGEEQASILVAAFRVMEHVIKYLGEVLDAVEDERATLSALGLSLDALSKMKVVMVDSMGLVVGYITQAAEEYPDQPPAAEMVDAFKLLGLWLQEEAASVSGPLQKSLPFILDYALGQLGHAVCFLLPGLALYLETPEHAEVFTEQGGFAKVAEYLILHLPPLLRHVKETESTANTVSTTVSSSLSKELKPLGIDSNTIVNVIIPKSCEILQIYFNDAIANKPRSQSDVVLKSVFTRLISLLATQISSISSNMSVAFWDTYLVNQYIIGNLMVLALSVLLHYEESHFTLDSLQSLFNAITNFYTNIEIPQINNQNDNRYQTLWSNIKEYYITGIDLITQIFDRYPSLSSTLIAKRWPPNDFSISQNQNNSFLELDSQTIINVNRNINNLIRKLLEPRR